MKRNWPDFYKLYYNKIPAINLDEFIQDWLEANIPKDVLDKIAPIVCENHEPRVEPFDLIHGVNIICRICKHCGAEIQPEKWVIK